MLLQSSFPSDPTTPRVLALGERAMSALRRGVWVVCIGIYLAVFISGLQAGGGELVIMGRAVALALLAGVLGRIIIGILGRASLPGEPTPMAMEQGTLGPHVGAGSSTNVAQRPDEAHAGLIGEREASS